MEGSFCSIRSHDSSCVSDFGSNVNLWCGGHDLKVISPWENFRDWSRFGYFRRSDKNGHRSSLFQRLMGLCQCPVGCCDQMC